MAANERKGDRHRPRHLVSVPAEIWAEYQRRAKALERSTTWLICHTLRQSSGRDGAAQTKQ